MGRLLNFLTIKARWFRMDKTQRRQSVVKRGKEGGFIFHLAIHIPILKFSKIPFALFVGTSNLHSV